IVAGVASAGDQVANHLFRSLPGIVGTLVSPAVVQRHAGFPCATVGLGSDVLLRSGKVSGEFVPIVKDDVGLSFEEHLVHALRLPLIRAERPSYVIPENITIAVFGHQLAYEPMCVPVESFASAFILT